MKRVRTLGELDEQMSRIRKDGQMTGFVPTMGYLHEGHLSLIRESKRDNGVTVLSVFVNPAQFGEGEDFNEYPRDPERDSRLAGGEGADIFFEPLEREMYPQGYRTYVEVEELSGLLCGRSRPGHFRGVATVVAKLLNLVRPDVLYLGQKDAQQAVILRRMADDLDFQVLVKIMPTVREADGLAMSSRNRYLSDDERKAAPLLYRALSEAKASAERGCRDAGKIREKVRSIIEGEKKFSLEYAEVVDASDLGPVQKIEGRVLVCVAARLGRTRLIDNTLIGADVL